MKLFWMFVILVISASVAKAAEISLSAVNEVTVDDVKRTVTLQLRILNVGTVPANEVSLDFKHPRLKREIAEELLPKSEKAMSITWSFSDLGIDNGGETAITYLLHYKDGNFYPFTAPVIAFVRSGDSPGADLSIDLENQGDEAVLRDRLDTEALIENLGGKELTVTSVELFTPHELKIEKRPSGEKSLKGGESFQTSFSLSNKSALAGSVYNVPLVVGGSLDGKSFVRIRHLRVRVVPGMVSSKAVMWGGFCLILAWAFFKALESLVPRPAALSELS
jgi:hypothetical protein